MKINVILLFAFCYFLSGTLYAQSSVEPDERLYVAYSESDLIQLKQNSPATIDLLNFKLDNSWFIVEEELMTKVGNSPYLYYLDTETGQASTQMVEEINLDNLNIAEYYIEADYNRRVFYRIGNSGLVLGIYSSKEFVKLYNQSKTSAQ